ncbi:1-acyl-sn-glycerol-3-phosphate acyltransferase [Nocardiopsis gilva YIM 90087]|uniref:1-acyl-sn-glycerol-3-phosphate acyltransferase n=1 Tax=Nocardiopsis gilva YIM 90087 TaxID=1235441 RepID=A0A223SAR0_9ACTN|nr:lysophospholipid acyltransferase family protein [Nocardiopsis gilva]ASU85166.1 1-acyl-sn-glycerol-3-phosphate acyltransferase [Nocardiopsis gilva YIM 90087]
MAKQRESRWVKLVVASIVRPIMAAITKVDWRGQHHIPREGGVIVASNHLSLADPLTVAHYLYVAGRRWPTFTSKDSVFRIPVVGFVARSTGQIGVKRGSTDAVKALQEAERALVEDGCSVIFYPEGTCTRDPNEWPMVAKTGVARLALTAGVPVVPVAHWGEQELLRYGTTKVRPFPRKRVQYLAGPPVDLDKYRGEPITSSLLKDATADIMRAITVLQAEIRGEEPPAIPFDPKAARQERVTEGGTDAPDGTREEAGPATPPEKNEREQAENTATSGGKNDDAS